MICLKCNKEFTSSIQRRKYCSKECSKAATIETKKKHKQSERGRNTNRIYQQVYQKNYKQTDKGKALTKKARKKYEKSEKGKKTINKKNLKYLLTERGKLVQKKSQIKRRDSGLSAKYYRERRKSEPIYKLSADIRSRLVKFLKVNNMKKNNKTFTMVGCTPKFLKKYIEEQFKPGMTWQNHSPKGWHVDHIIPLASAKSLEEIKKLSHYTNLQPMWEIDNKKKSNKF
jgi:hypothetical protein